MCFSVLQCVAVCCSVLQCVAVCCSVLQSSLQVLKSCTDLDATLLYKSCTLLYILKLRKYSKFGRQNQILTPSVCFRNPARALAAGLPHQDHVWITTGQLVRCHKNVFDKMLCKLDSTEYARSFEPNPTLP